MDPDKEFDETVARAHLEASGWALEEHFHSNPFQCHVFYVCDFNAQTIRLYTIRRDDFQGVQFDELSSTDLASGLAEILRNADAGTLSEEEHKALPAVLAGYFKSTQTFRLWRQSSGADDRLHALVMLYPGGYVRPSAARCDSTVLAADSLHHMVQQILDIDRRNHPEWFARAAR